MLGITHSKIRPSTLGAARSGRRKERLAPEAAFLAATAGDEPHFLHTLAQTRRVLPTEKPDDGRAILHEMVDFESPGNQWDSSVFIDRHNIGRGEADLAKNPRPQTESIR